AAFQADHGPSSLTLQSPRSPTSKPGAFSLTARAIEKTAQKKTPPLGEGEAGVFPPPGILRGVGAAGGTLPAVPCSVSKGPLSPAPDGQYCSLTPGLAAGKSHHSLGNRRRLGSLQTCFRGGGQMLNASSPIMPIPISSTASATGS